MCCVCYAVMSVCNVCYAPREEGCGDGGGDGSSVVGSSMKVASKLQRSDSLITALLASACPPGKPKSASHRGGFELSSRQKTKRPRDGMRNEEQGTRDEEER